MSAIGLLAKLLESPQMEFTPSSCLKARYPEHQCQKCIEACPRPAITNNGDQIELDAAKCDGCGLCAGICPTEAFTLGKPTFAQLAALAGEKRNITLACEEAPLFGACTVPCLGYLPEVLLMGMVAGCDQVRLAYSAERCADCSRQAGDLLAERFERVREFAGQLGRAEVPVLEENNRQDAVSRSEFFSFLKDRTKSLAKQLPVPLFEPERKEQGEYQEKRLPISRQLFLKMAARSLADLDLGEVSGESWAFGENQVGDRCDGCGECILFCPTESLRLEDGAHGQKLVHVPARCLDCGICEVKCPQQVISKKEGLDLALVVSGASAVVKRFKSHPCPRCGRPVTGLAESKNRQCSQCEREANHMAQTKKRLFGSLR